MNMIFIPGKSIGFIVIKCLRGAGALCGVPLVRKHDQAWSHCCMESSFSPVTPSREDARELVTWDLPALCASASVLRRKRFGNAVSLCAIINAKSGNCGMDCAFCSQSGRYAAAAVFPLLTPASLRERIARARQFPIRHCGIVTSGVSLSRDEILTLAGVLQAEREVSLPRLCASLGRLGSDALALLRDAGLRRYHHNLECAEAYYPRLCSTQTWRGRLDTVRLAGEQGLEVCCGGLFGAGESWEDRLDFAFTLAAEGIREVPLNFLHPVPGTPLAAQPVPAADEVLRIIAVFRHILPEATLRVCGGRVHALGARQEEIFAAGANALMTGDYLTTAGSGIQEDMDMIARLGLEIAA
jgi:biotin synthase